MSSFQMCEKSWDKKRFFQYSLYTIWVNAKSSFKESCSRFTSIVTKIKNVKLFISKKLKNIALKLNFFPYFLYFVGFFQNTQIYTIIAPPLRLKICWFSQGGGGNYCEYPKMWKTTIFQTKKVKKKIFFFRKNASKAVKNFCSEKWPKFF